MDLVTDRAERPRGLLASLSEFWARARAEAPATVATSCAHCNGRGYFTYWGTGFELCGDCSKPGEMDAVLRGIGTSPSKTVGPPNPIAKLPSGYEYRATPAVEWARAAGLDPDVAALAWCLASEAPDIRRYPSYSVAIAEAVCNAASGAGPRIYGRLSITNRVCFDRRTFDERYSVQALYFGRQGGRWCSSFQPPTAKHVKCAELVLNRARAGMPNLLAGGAIGWLDPLVQVKMNRKKPATNPTPEHVVRRWAAHGKEWVGPVVDARGEAILDPFRLMLFKKVEKAKTLDALKALENGHLRWRC